jgi:hypothetical protein
MKITSRGAPIYVDERDNGGFVINQGTSFIRLSADEVDALMDALEQLSH